MKTKKTGRPVELPEAADDESAAPTQADIVRADALGAADPLLAALWNAEPVKEDAD